MSNCYFLPGLNFPFIQRGASRPEVLNNLSAGANQFGVKSFNGRGTREHVCNGPSIQESHPVIADDLINVDLDKRSCATVSFASETSLLIPRNRTHIDFFKEKSRSETEVIIEFTSLYGHRFKKQSMVFIEAKPLDECRKFYGFHKVIDSDSKNKTFCVSIDPSSIWNPVRQKLFSSQLTNGPARAIEIEMPCDPLYREKLLDRMGFQRDKKIETEV